MSQKKVTSSEEGARAPNPTNSRRGSVARAFRSIGDAILITDVEGRVVYLNGTAELLVGRRIEDARGMHASDVLPLTADKEAQRKLASAEIGVTADMKPTGLRRGYLHTHADGQKLISYEASPVRDNSGNIQGAVIAFNEVPAKAKQQRLGSRDRLEIIARATDDTAWDWNLLSDEVWWSDELTTLFGYAPEDVQPSSQWWFDHVHPDDREEYVSHLWAHIRSPETYWNSEYRFERADGSHAYVFERGYTLRNRAGEPVRMIGAMMDVTARRSAQAEVAQLNSELETLVRERTAQLEQANEELGQVNKELESFSYSVSHDLRSPVRSILGRAMMIREDEGEHLGVEGHQHLEALTAAAKRMEGLIEDLLAYSRLARKELHRASVDLTALSEWVVSELGKTDYGNRCAIKVQPGMEVLADSDLVRVVMENLIDNACKYSSRGQSPQVWVGMTEDSGPPVFYVRDNGVGFDPALCERLFQPFERLNSDFPGTGIGLANVQRIVHRHGGRIWAESQPGEGATFYFTLEPSARNVQAPYVA